jgi:flagellar hook assembly protein FlgD
VYDVAGRLVRTLVNGEVRTGTSTVVWDGTDHGKRAVASGIYFCRLEWNGRGKSARLVFFK